jgi:hypothetical protein
MQLFTQLSRLTIIFMVCLIASCTSVLAQGDSCKTAELPIGVVNANGESYMGLNASSFTAHAGKITTVAKAMTYDDAPRRIILVVDQGKKLNADSRKAQEDMLAVILGAARAEDSFGLITARGPAHVVKFGEDRPALSAAIKNEVVGSHGKELGVMDAILQAIDMFGEGKPGDAIIVMAYDLEGNHGANAKRVAKALEEHHVRMFGLALGPVSTRNIALSGQSTTAWGLATATSAVGDVLFDTGDDNFYPLTTNSGGLVIAVMNYDPKRTFSMKDAALEAKVKTQARAIFNMVSTYYRMEFEPLRLGRGEEWTVKVDDNVRKSIPRMFLLYPHQVAGCPAVVSATAK